MSLAIFYRGQELEQPFRSYFSGPSWLSAGRVRAVFCSEIFHVVYFYDLTIIFIIEVWYDSAVSISTINCHHTVTFEAF